MNTTIESNKTAHDVLKPELYIATEGRWWRRPTIWLMLNKLEENGTSFTVGIFRSQRVAEMCLEKLERQLKNINVSA